MSTNNAEPKHADRVSAISNDGKRSYTKNDDETINANDITITIEKEENVPPPLQRHRSLEWKKASLTVQSSTTKNDNTDDKMSSRELSILNGLSGCAYSHELTCIMGRSGAGKTSLLNVLSGKITKKFSSSTTKVQGVIKLNGKKIDPSSTKVKDQIAFVAQHDTLLATQTPREAITFSARLRLGNKNHTKKDIDQLTNDILEKLQLTNVADSLIGGKRISGLSGGEMRRVSLAIELVVNPSVLLLDEVTSGLDSYNAIIVMKACKAVAMSGAAVIMTIHQPNSAIFKLMDKLILLNHGQCMYYGRADQLADFFSECGYKMPKDYNPADWAIEVVDNVDHHELHESMSYSYQDDPQKFFLLDHSKKDLEQLSSNKKNHYNDDDDGNSTCSSINIDSDLDNTVIMTSQEYASNSPAQKERPNNKNDNDNHSWEITAGNNSTTRGGSSGWMQFSLLLLRDLTHIKRDRKGMILRFMMLAFGAILMSVAYMGVGTDSLEDSTSFRSHVGAAFVVIFNTSVVIQLTVLDMSDELDVFIREFRTNHYNIIPYGLSKTLIETILNSLQSLLCLMIMYWSMNLSANFWYWFACIFAFSMVQCSLAGVSIAINHDPRHAREFVILFVVPQMLLCGYLVNVEDLPIWIQWTQWIMPLTYAYRLVLYGEFSKCLDYTEHEQQVVNCIKSLQQSLLNNKSNFLYNDKSVFTFPQGGVYKGTEAIGEYILYTNSGQNQHAILWDYCPMDGTAAAIINEVVDGYCDVTVASVYQTQINLDLIKEEYKASPWVQFVVGDHLRYTYSDDLESITIVDERVYFPPIGMGEIYMNALNNTALAVSACNTLELHCPTVFESHNEFESHDQCVSAMSSLPVATTSTDGIVVVDGNSTSCRHLHSALTTSRPDIHCPHVSFKPLEDMEGKTKCSVSNNFEIDKLFTKDDMKLFEKAAVHFGLDGQRQSELLLKKSELDGTCSTGRHSFELSGLDELDQLPDTFFCASYLESQNANGDNNTYYWLAQLVMFVTFKAITWYYMRRKS